MIRLRLDYTPRDWQQECHRRLLRFSVLALHRRAGKTELAIMELLDKALQFDKDLGQFFYVAPYLKQAKAIAWARLKQKIEPLRQHEAVEVNEGELWVRFKHNGAMIRIFGGDNPDAMRGVRLDGVVIDEVAPGHAMPDLEAPRYAAIVAQSATCELRIRTGIHRHREREHRVEDLELPGHL